MHAAPIHHLDAGVLELGDERGEILLAGADAFVDHLGDAEIVHRLLRLVGETLAVRRLVVDDGDLLILQMLGDVLAGDGALLIVATAGAEHVPQLALGYQRVGGRRRDHQDAVVDVDLGCRQGDAGIEVADDEVDAIAKEIVGDRDALTWIGSVVADGQFDLLAIDAAGRVDVGDGLLDTVLELRAERCVVLRHRPGHTQLQLCRSAVTAGEQGGEGERQGCKNRWFHGGPLKMGRRAPGIGAHVHPKRAKSHPRGGAESSCRRRQRRKPALS